MYLETHIVIHVVVLFILQADRQANEQIDRYIFCRCIDLIQSFNNFYFAHLVLVARDYSLRRSVPDYFDFGPTC